MKNLVIGISMLLLVGGSVSAQTNSNTTTHYPKAHKKVAAKKTHKVVPKKKVAQVVTTHGVNSVDPNAGAPTLGEPSDSAPSRQAPGYESRLNQSTPPPDKRSPPGFVDGPAHPSPAADPKTYAPVTPQTTDHPQQYPGNQTP